MMCDVTLVGDDRFEVIRPANNEIDCHSCILAAASPYLRRLIAAHTGSYRGGKSPGFSNPDFLERKIYILI